MLISIFWCLFNCVVLVLALYDVLKRLYNRRDHRFPVQLKCGLRMWTEMSASVPCGIFHRAGSAYSFRKALVRRRHRRRARVAGRASAAEGAVAYSKPASGGTFVGIRFCELTEAQKTALFRFLFITTPRRLYDEERNRPRKFWKNTEAAAQDPAE
jgi:hypothetical protein